MEKTGEAHLSLLLRDPQELSMRTVLMATGLARFL